MCRTRSTASWSEQTSQSYIYIISCRGRSGKSVTDSIASKDEKLVLVGLNHGFCSVGMACDEILHIGVTQGSRDGKNTVDTVIENQATSTGNTAAFILVATLMVIG